jgi:flagellar biosynthesis protein FlhB
MASRPHPPSAQRVLEARASGHLPRAALLWLAGALGLLAVGAAVGPNLGERLRASWSEELLRAAAGEPTHVRERLAALSSLLAGSLAVILALLLGVGWLVQGPGFASWARRTHFERVGLDRTASLVWALGLVLLTGFTLADFASWAWGFALLSVGCLVIDVAFARARWFASLWLTRREYVDMQREQAPAPEVRARMRRGA